MRHRWTRLAAAAAWLSFSCLAPPPRPAWVDPAPRPDSVDAVVFLIGDAGDAVAGRSPVTERLAEAVEHWAEAVGRDSSVAVLFLGDNVYPLGVRAPGSDDFVRDSLRLASQVRAVAGPAARRYRVRGYFLAGNHDWGQSRGPEGLERLRNQDRLLDRFREHGVAAVELVPEPGAPGPVMLEIGSRARFLALDTQWWLQVREQTRQQPVLDDLRRLLKQAGPDAAVAAHHPWTSGGMHGGHPVPGAGYGIHWLLGRTGALVQDLNSVPYRDLRADLGALFGEVGAPLLWVSGHDHSLQLFRGSGAAEPVWTLVSGAGSDPTGVGAAEGMVWGAAEPGFMRLTWMRGGAVHLHVLATEAEYAVCEGSGAALRRCMEEGQARFRLVFAATLRDGAGTVLEPSDIRVGTGGR